MSVDGGGARGVFESDLPRVRRNPHQISTRPLVPRGLLDQRMGSSAGRVVPRGSAGRVVPRGFAGRVVPGDGGAGHVSRPPAGPQEPSPDLDTAARSSRPTRSADGESRWSSNAPYFRWSSSAPARNEPGTCRDPPRVHRNPHQISTRPLVPRGLLDQRMGSSAGRVVPRTSAGRVVPGEERAGHVSSRGAAFRRTGGGGKPGRLAGVVLGAGTGDGGVVGHG